MKKTPVTLTYYFSTISQHLQKLCENMCANESYVCKELLFRLQTCGNDSVTKLTYDEYSIGVKLTELNYVVATITMLENQLARYSISQPDVLTYFTSALVSDVYVQPRPDASTYVLFDVLKLIK
jgi:hypothetical protein